MVRVCQSLPLLYILLHLVVLVKDAIEELVVALGGDLRASSGTLDVDRGGYRSFVWRVIVCASAAASLVLMLLLSVCVLGDLR